MPTIWTPRVASNDNKWPSGLRMQAGDASSALNQIISVLNAQAGTSFPFVSLLSTKINRAFFASLINAINNLNGHQRDIILPVSSDLTRTLIGQLRDAMLGTANTGFDQGISRQYTASSPPVDLFSYIEQGNVGTQCITAFNTFPLIGREFLTIDVSGVVDLKLNINVPNNNQVSGGGTLNTPFFLPFSVYQINDSLSNLPLIFDLHLQGSPVANIQPGGAGNIIFDLGNYNSGSYTFCIVFDSDVQYVANANGTSTDGLYQSVGVGVFAG